MAVHGCLLRTEGFPTFGAKTRKVLGKPRQGGHSWVYDCVLSLKGEKDLLVPRGRERERERALKNKDEGLLGTGLLRALCLKSV